MAIHGEAILVEEGLAGHEVVLERAPQQPTACIVAVVRQAVAVRDQEQTHRAQECRLAEAAPAALAYEAMREAREAARHLAAALGTKGMVLQQGGPPCP